MKIDEIESQPSADPAGCSRRDTDLESGCGAGKKNYERSENLRREDGISRDAQVPRHHRILPTARVFIFRSEEHTSELQSRRDLVCRLLLEKKKRIRIERLQQYNESTHR